MCVIAREEDRKRLNLAFPFNDRLSEPSDPPQHLEALRATYIPMLEEVAERWADLALTGRICLDMLKVSSLGRTRIDVTGRRAPLELPDLSYLTVEELKRLIRLSEDPQVAHGKPFFV